MSMQCKRVGDGEQRDFRKTAQHLKVLPILDKPGVAGPELVEDMFGLGTSET